MHLDETRYININFNKSRKAYGQLLNATRKEMEDQIRFEILSDIIA